MNQNEIPETATWPFVAITATPAVTPQHQAPDLPIPHLVGQVYESGPPVERCRLLEHLLSPLGALSLAFVANGVFAEMRFRSGWQHLHVRIEDAQKVCANDVAALADHVQQVSVESVDALARILSVWPVMSGSAAAARLMAGLMRRDPSVQILDHEDDDAAQAPA